MKDHHTKIRIGFILSALFVVIITASGSAFLVFSIRLGDQWLAREISRTYLSIIDQKGSFIEEEVQRIHEAIESTVQTNEVVDILSRPLSGYERSTRIIDFREEVAPVAALNDIKNIYVYRDDTLHFYLHDIIFRYEPEFRTTWWYEQATLGTPPRVTWLGLLPDQFNETAYQFYLSRPVVQMSRGELREVGLAFATVDRLVFDRILADLGESGVTYVENEIGRMVYCTDPAESALCKAIADNYHPTDSPNYLLTGRGEKRSIIVVGARNALGWRIIHQAPFNGYPPEIEFTRRLLAGIFGLSLATFVAFLFIYRSRIGVPLRRLARIVFSLDPARDPSAEVSVDPRGLQERVGQIVEDTKSYVTQLKHSERERQIAEVRKLRAQMNPHFLFKILNNIRFIAMLNDQTQIVEITDELFSLVTAGISDADVVTMAQESAMLNSYAKLIHSIYNQNVTLEISIEDDALDCYVPKFMLQPIVENALYHGMDPNSPGGIIQVSGRVEKDRLFVSVEDNGTGLSTESPGLRENAEPGERSHLGLVGTDKRLRLLFGDDYDIRIGTSTLGGALVSLSFPTKRDPLQAANAG